MEDDKSSQVYGQRLTARPSLVDQEINIFQLKFTMCQTWPHNTGTHLQKLSTQTSKLRETVGMQWKPSSWHSVSTQHIMKDFKWAGNRCRASVQKSIIQFSAVLWTTSVFEVPAECWDDKKKQNNVVLSFTVLHHDDVSKHQHTYNNIHITYNMEVIFDKIMSVFAQHK